MTTGFSEIGRYRPSIEKDKDAELDYTFDWTDWLGGATILAHEVTVLGAVKINDALAGSLVTVWVGGSPAGTKLAWATCHVEASDGRQDDRTMYFLIRDR